MNTILPFKKKPKYKYFTEITEERKAKIRKRKKIVLALGIIILPITLPMFLGALSLELLDQKLEDWIFRKDEPGE